MFERFTEKAIKVIMLAQEEARRLGHNFVGTEQVLLGLIGEGTGIAARALRSMGVTQKDARREVEKIIGRGSGFVAVEIPFTPNAKRILEEAWNEARQLGHNHIGTEHLLLGLLNLNDGVGLRVLENLNVDLVVLRRKVHEPLSANKFGSLPVEPDLPTIAELQRGFSPWFRQDVVEIVRGAVNASVVLGTAVVGPEHLLLALLADSSVSSAMSNVNFDVVQFRKKLLLEIEPGSETSSQSRSFSVESEELLKRTWAQATALEQGFITRDSILLGLLSEPESSTVGRVLRDSAVDLSELRSILERRAEKAPPKSEVDAVGSALEERVATDQHPGLLKVTLFVVVFACILAALAHYWH